MLKVFVKMKVLHHFVVCVLVNFHLDINTTTHTAVEAVHVHKKSFERYLVADARLTDDVTRRVVTESRGRLICSTWCRRTQYCQAMSLCQHNDEGIGSDSRIC